MVFEDVSLARITLHPEIAEDFRDLADVLPHRFPGGTFSEAALLHLCLAHPIQVLPRDSDTKEVDQAFWCVGGIRTFQLVKPRLSPDQPVPVLPLSSPPEEAISDLATLDLFLGSVAFGIRGSRHGEQVAAMWRAVPVALMRKYCPPLKSLAAIARHLGWDPRALTTTEKLTHERKGHRG